MHAPVGNNDDRVTKYVFNDVNVEGELLMPMTEDGHPRRSTQAIRTVGISVRIYAQDPGQTSNSTKPLQFSGKMSGVHRSGSTI